METIVKYELFQVCQPNLVTPEYVVWRSERVNGGIVLPFAVTEAFNVFFRLPSEAEIVRQEFYTKRREWEREKEELQRQVFELQLDVQGMGDHLTVAAKRQTRLALIEDEKPFGDREDTTKFVQCEAEDGSSKVFQNLCFRPFQVKSETKLPIPTSRNKSIFDAVGRVSSKPVFQVSQSLKRKYHIIRERRIHYAKEQKNKPVQD
ncbi:hypothetical protein P3L10_003023 [Capsicum annuum]|uniref:Uncharacterized protein n=2 Tax=Capsicum annuum TaxID=4072 RepID=A0A075VWR2_CAPAN|nr:hypothetical protein [Capsicum annuum]AIG89893.1 hypothetical protein [Capsicum annuum]AIG90175.1 hypothetical protein [Capsicum annuum]QFV19664.1 hypothetical protein [Capsicum annuum var. glabriusculum]